MKSLFDFGDEVLKENSTVNDNFNSNKAKNDAKNDNKSDLESNFKSIYEKYKGFSQDDLVSEFLRITNEQKANGQLNNEKILSTYNTLLPYLNPQQQDFLKKTLGLIYDK